ncbi:MAG: hypothetical protein WCS34_09740 [Bacteroidales bacterium]
MSVGIIKIQSFEGAFNTPELVESWKSRMLEEIYQKHSAKDLDVSIESEKTEKGIRIIIKATPKSNK